MHSITLKAYDVLRGFGNAFLNIKIWHTGVLVHGHEFFFGGGICQVKEGSFEQEQGITALRRIDMGSTTKTFEEILEWIQANTSSWTAEGYHILDRNCNHFSNAFLKFLLDSEEDLVPHDILHQQEYLPPFAQQFLPLVRQFQDPFAASGNPGGPPAGFPSMASTTASTMASTATFGNSVNTAHFGSGTTSMGSVGIGGFPGSTPPNLASSVGVAPAVSPTGLPPRPPSHPVATTPFSKAVEKLASNSQRPVTQRIEGIELLKVLAQNVKDHATEQKYRRIKSSQQRVITLKSLPHGTECLLELGFRPTPEGEFYELNEVNAPVLAQLHASAHFCSEVLAELTHFEAGEFGAQIRQLKDMGFDKTDFQLYR
eukprot:Protomagalhaensia_sp_Gyna_25__4453@NODE_407_length_3545_cov_62_169424_g313_i0_p2_GENE_NODE_407_length_3545_cov_62_169424_g313_i0NODE_407_length_3545_cov_62_169424_g313_i0_p2_ORF_typecomplete_len371_score57_53Peptidase_C97/PF05903_14/6_4e25Peptidase_C97/PF05903_14/1_2e03PUB/PF09409_10/3_1e11PUB/PF09409_10/1_2e04DUF4796/PF16044_5/0_016UBA/PF00627_31/2_5e03UBA/PF00627_31/0_3LRAT/PF04970_13/0_15HSF_DNAbind/PF00447_17/2_3e03HSF_DNAbind/PF00447_17/0_94_NODE_407_length_3545_cov_62_169424_g313_i01051216